VDRYRTVDALVAAIIRRRLADRSSEVEHLGRFADGGTRIGIRSNGRLRVVRDDAGAVSAARMLKQEQNDSPHAMMTELLVVGDDAWVRLDQRVRRDARQPWLRIDPAGADVNSQYFAPQVAGLGRDHPFDILLAGRVTMVDAEPDPVDGRPAMRYTLDVELDGSGEDAVTAEQFRVRGVSSMRPVVHVDAADRMLRCCVRADFAGGGRYLLRHRLLAPGEPITILPPPDAQVADPGQVRGAAPSAADEDVP
jgi:hypothetical protein